MQTREPYKGLLPKSRMEYIAREPDGLQWFYDDKAKKYVRFNGEEFSMWVSGKYLPDPFILWQKRQDLGGLPGDTRPQDVTFALFDHWQKVRA